MVSEENPQTTSQDACPNKASGDPIDKNEPETKKTEIKKKENSGASKFFSYNLVGRKTEENFQFKSGIAPTTMPGHTGYLTIAALYL